MNRKLYFLLIICYCLSFTVSTATAQSFLSNSKRGVSKVPERGLVLTVNSGLAAVRSDICGTPGCNNLGLNVGVGALYKLSPYLGASAQLEHTRLGASEKDPSRPLNVSFRSEVISLTGTAVVNLLDSYAGSGGYRSRHKRFIVPYVRAGAGLIYYTPTSYPGQGDLKDSQTTYDPERDYPAIAAVIPVGAGLRFRLNDEFSVATELMYNFTTTDYLDNIGPLLDSPSNSDQFSVAGIRLLYTPKIQNKIFQKNYGR
ncbi:outer membrane beta-barrel protein [Pontibacter sp. CAU 1760]